MDQPSLFDGHSVAGDCVTVAFAPNFTDWQRAARGPLYADIAPQRVWWQPLDRHIRERVPRPDEPHADPSQPLRVPRAYIERARAAACHSRADRWALLYRILWRLTHGEWHLLALAGDADIVRLQRYVNAVHRDVHKMKAFVRFRAVTEDGDTQPRYVAWFQPEHPILEYAAGFFRRRFANMRWSILTPYRCAHWDGHGAVWFSPGVDKRAGPEGDWLEDAWRVYYRNIFNPARLKMAAMASEMPQKYWKNLPEAHDIGQLARTAASRVAAMEANPKETDVLHCGPRPATPATINAKAIDQSPPASLARLALLARTCRGCPLWQSATQTVFGEGPANARIMIVGEQPGDHEDLTGRPFVGPAGAILDRALAAAHLARETLYLTNAVKHFKFEPRGKHRLHAKPAYREIDACRSWLQAEIDHIRPALVVCLGATAARALLGPGVRMTRDRGTIVERGGQRILPSFHPAYLLRIQNKPSAGSVYAQFVDDLKQAAAYSAPSPTASNMTHSR